METWPSVSAFQPAAIIPIGHANATAKTPMLIRAVRLNPITTARATSEEP